MNFAFGFNFASVVNQSGGGVAPVISITSGSGYAGSVYTSTVAGQRTADGADIVGETGETWTMTPEYEGAAIRCGNSNAIQLGIGPELIVNGDLSDGTTGWSAQNDAAITVVDGWLRVTRTLDGSNFPNARQTLTGLTVGATYRSFYEFRDPFGNNLLLPPETFTATSTSRNISFGFSGFSGSAGDYMEARNISVKRTYGDP